MVAETFLEPAGFASSVPFLPPNPSFASVKLAKVLLSLPRPIANSSDDDTADAPLEHLHNLLVALRNLRVSLNSLALLAIPADFIAKDRLESARDALLVFGEVVDDSVGAGVEGVAADDLAGGIVDGLAHAHGGAGGVVHIKDGRVGVEAGGVEVVGVLHGERGEGLEVAVLDGLFHGFLAFGDDVGRALLEEGRGCDGRLHASRGGDVFLFGAGDEDAGAHFGPVAGRCYLVGQAVASVLLFSLLPAGVASEQTAACGAGALASDLAEVGRSGGELVEVCNGADESSEASSAGSETGGGGEVVLTDDLELEVGELGKGVVVGLDIFTELAKLAETSLGPCAGDVLVLAVQGEGVVGEVGAARGGGVGAEVILREGDGERGVGGQVEFGVSLSPVPEGGSEWSVIGAGRVWRC